MITPPSGGRRDEAVMLLGCDARERLEPMRVVGRPARDRPVLHGGGHRVRHAQIETGPSSMVFLSDR